jgi:hypothetical protein
MVNDLANAIDAIVEVTQWTGTEEVRPNCSVDS